jgi:lipoyl(octanoyl) transferase
MIQCYVHDIGRISFEDAYLMQKQAVSRLQQGSGGECFFLLEHPHVVTNGRNASDDSLLGDPVSLKSKGITFVHTDRGGDVTYHGPGQLVGYPIFRLESGRRDVRKFALDIETALMNALAPYGIACNRHGQYRGVWTRGRKIASIGLRISRWVTSHGFALNVNTDLSYFSFIRPCGISGCEMTSMERELGSAVDMTDVKHNIMRSFSQVFQREMIPGEGTGGFKSILE